MLILALDSSAGSATAAICKDGRTIAEMTLDNGNKHSETLLPMSDALFRMIGVGAADVNLFAVTVGPGSFTGVRIGVSLVKGLAFGRNKPCVGVSSLEALAYGALGIDCIACPLIDARHDSFYGALFKVKDGIVERLCPDMLVSLPELQEMLRDLGDDLPVMLLGDGARDAHEYLKKTDDFSGIIDIFVAPSELCRTLGSSVAAAAVVHYQNGEYCTDSSLVPIYLRPSQAERERLERLNKA